MREQVSETPFFCFPYYCFNISLSCLAAYLPVLPFLNAYTSSAGKKKKKLRKINKTKQKKEAVFTDYWNRGIGTLHAQQVCVVFNIHLRCQTSYFAVQKQQRADVRRGGGCDRCDSSA